MPIAQKTRNYFNALLAAGEARARGLGKSPKVKSKGTKKKQTSFEQKVKAVINKNVETQQLTQTIYDSGNTSTNFFNSSISIGALGTQEIYDVLPSVSRANNAASYQREGDKIMPTWCNLRFKLSLSSGQPIHAYLFVLMDKQNTDANNRTSDTYQFLNLNGNNTNFDGGWVNAGLPIDTERFKIIKRKRIRLAYDAQPGGSPTAPTEPSPIFKEVSVKINMQKHCEQLDYYGYPSTLNQPKNCNMFWAIGYLNADTTADTVGRLRVTCVSTLYFKDA